MRMMIRFSFSSHDGNELVASGKVGEIFEKLLEDLKPEAAYFYPEGGERGGVMFVNMTDSSDIVRCGEPFWFALGAVVDMTPVMSAEDLMKGMQQIPALAERYL